MAISAVSPCRHPGHIAHIITDYTGEDSYYHLDVLARMFMSTTEKYVPLPDDLVRDPVTYHPLSGDCVLTRCGHTFNRATMQGLDTCPMCRAPAPTASLRPSISVSSVMGRAENFLLKVFIEVEDRTVTAVNPERLPAFNQALAARLIHLDGSQAYESRVAHEMNAYYAPAWPKPTMYRDPVVAPCGHSKEREEVARGGISCCGTALTTDMCVTNYLMRDQIAWVKAYNTNSDWAVRDVETLPGKAGLFLHLRDTTAIECIGQLARAIFNPTIQMMAPMHFQKDLLLSLGKFRSLDELTEAIRALPGSVMSDRLPRLHYVRSDGPLQLERHEKLGSAPKTEVAGSSYTHLILSQWGAQTPLAFLASELIDILETDAERQSAALL
jgi:hypothetical protein